MTTPDHERMSSVDTAWLRMDSPGSAMMIVSVTATETPLRLDEFRRMIETRFLCFPRFRLRPVADPLGASWVQDGAFDLDAHLLRVKLPAPAGKAELQAFAAELAGRPLNPDRPLWQVHLVEHYLGGSAWIMRIHHCYADGIAMVEGAALDDGAGLGPGHGGHERRRTRRHAVQRATSAGCGVAAAAQLDRSTFTARQRHPRERHGRGRKAARGRHPQAVSPGAGRGDGEASRRAS